METRHSADGTAQRRRVAVMFADLSGFTELVQRAEPEVVYDVVRPLLDELVLLVRLHDGVVQQVLGDGFMCVFGLPGAPASPAGVADRAIQAGRSVVAAGGAGGAGGPGVHVGIEAGEVLVTPAWEPAAYGVWGRAVTMAARLCGSAGPGELAIGPAAYAEAGCRVRGAHPVRVRLKGIADPVVSHVLAPRPAAVSRAEIRRLPLRRRPEPVAAAG